MHLVFIHFLVIPETASPVIMAANDGTFQGSLLSIADEITKDKLDRLRFLRQDDLPKGKLEAVKIPLEFLELLLKRGKICLGNASYLANLQTCKPANNIQLANKVKEEGT